MKKIALYIAIGISVFACKNRNSGKIADIEASKKDTAVAEPYYPVSQYVEGQLGYVDSTPLMIVKLTFIDNKQVDSVVIDHRELRALAEEFRLPDLNDPKVKLHYEENSYNDLTLNNITFSYTAKHKELEMQQEDVLLNPDNNKVKNIMFRKNRTVGDTSMIVNGLWKNNMNFQINYLMQLPGGKSVTKQVKVIWDRPFPTN